MVSRIWGIRQQFWENDSWFLLRDIARAYFAMPVKHFLENRGVVLSYLLTRVISNKSTFSVSCRENHSQRKILGRRGYQDEHVYTYRIAVVMEQNYEALTWTNECSATELE